MTDNAVDCLKILGCKEDKRGENAKNKRKGCYLGTISEIESIHADSIS
jgi:hypothetical protein